MKLPTWLHSDYSLPNGALRTQSWGSRYTIFHVIRMKARDGWSVWIFAALGFALTTGPEDPVAEGRVSARESCPAHRFWLWHFKNGRAIELSYAPEGGSDA